MAAGVERDDEVLVSSLSFIAPANTVRYVGAWPVFIDADPDFWQMDPQRVDEFLEHDCTWRAGSLYNKTSGRRIKAIIPVHILGHPVDLADLCGISRFELDEEAPAPRVLDLRGEPRCERSWKRDGTVKRRGDGGMLSDRDANALGV